MSPDPWLGSRVCIDCRFGPKRSGVDEDICCSGFGLFRRVWYGRRVGWWREGNRRAGRAAAVAGEVRGGRAGLGLGEEYFELVGEDEEDEDEDYNEDGRLKADVEWEERRRRAGEGGIAGEGVRGGGNGRQDDERTKKLQKLDVV